MNQEFNTEGKTNRFIFSDDFYNKLDDEPESKESNNIFGPIITPFEQVVREPELKSKIEDNKVIDNSITSNYENIIDIPKITNENINVSNQQLSTNIPNEIVKPVEDQVKIDIPQMNFKYDTIEQEPEVKVDNNEENYNFFKMPNVNTDNNNISDNVVLTQPEIKAEELADFNQSLKIDKELEQELMKLNVENQPKSSLIQKGKWFDENKEKPLYRAVRNNVPTINLNTSDNDFEEPISINTNPQVAEINKLFKQPPVTNIDELLKQDEAQLLKKELAYKKEMEAKLPVTKSDLLEQLRKKETETSKISILARYRVDFCANDYITNPAIGRGEEIKQLILILLTPEKSGILVGKNGNEKTAIVEGLAYRLQRNLVPDALKGYRIVSIKTTSLLGTLPNGETRLQTLIDEIKDLDKVILFIDEVHMLMGATNDSSLDFANMFKESLGRGSIKMIGATTNDEYERYVLRDKAFVRRFQRVDVEEPSREHTIEILMGSLPKIEKNTGVKLKYSEYIKTEIMGFIVDITTEYKRIYGIGSRYPDICLTLLSQAFSQAVFDNRKEVNILDIRNAIENSKNIYPDVIRKELVNFDKKFEKIINEE